MSSAFSEKESRTKQSASPVGQADHKADSGDERQSTRSTERAPTNGDASVTGAVSSHSYKNIPEPGQTLRQTLKISVEPDFASATEYKGILSVTGSNSTKVKAGYFKTYVINKNLKDEDSKEVWKPEFLDSRRGRRDHLEMHVREGLQVGESERCPQMLFERDGSVRRRPELHLVQKRLASTRRVLYISEVALEDGFGGPGLAQLGMLSFLHAISCVPGPYAYKGCVFLSPTAFRNICDAHVADCKIRNVRPKSRLEVEEALVASYKKSGYEVRILGNRDKGGFAITIMDMFFNQESIVAKIDELMLAADAKRTGTAIVKPSAGS